MKIIVSSILSFAFMLSVAYAQTYVTEKGHAEVHGKAPVSKYTGLSDELEGEINTETNTVNFKLKLESLNTGNHKRNKHMYETLGISSNPYATFDGKLSDFDPGKKEVQNVTVKGNFTIHGVTKEIDIKGTLGQSDNGNLAFVAAFPVNITEYGMQRPKIFAYKVEDKHIINVHGTLQKRENVAKK